MLNVPIDQLIPPEEGADPVGEDLRRQESLHLFGTRLDSLFRKQVADRSLLEERWLKDTRQYHGEYEDDVLQRIKEAGGSEAFINLTRVKCNATESRLAEMLLPTDDRNWSIEPTPQPDLRNPLPPTPPPPPAMVEGPDGQPVPDPNQPPVDPAAQAAAEADLVAVEAKRASDRMQRQMDDQLAECGYNAVLRSVLHNMAVLGTGILKGPVIRNRVKQAFVKSSTPDPATGVPLEQWTLQVSEDLAPGAESVNPWDFFPDMRATRMEDAEFVFQRHRMSKSQLRALTKLPGFMPDQINDLLSSEPDKSYAGSVDMIDSADKTAGSRSGYEVLEYHGPLEAEDMLAAGMDVDPEDQLTVHHGTVWFCNSRVIKATMSMLDSNEIMYDVVPLERDDTMMFGFGVPYLMRHSQRAGNAAWRMVLDNARLSVGGQVVWKKGKVRPVNGDYRLAPLKGWEMTDPNGNIGDVFGIVAIPVNFGEMFRILETVRMLQDEETGLPMIAQGQQSPSVTKTAQGMSILMNSANTVLRRMVKEFDDAITSRFIKRLYQWNMQYGEDEEAKGDYCVLALGSSSLMVREQQTQGLMQLAQLGATHPEFEKRTKWGDLYRTVVKSMNINADGLVKTDEEVQAEEEAAAQQPQIPPELQLEMAKLEMGKAELSLKATAQKADAELKQAQAQAEIAEKQARNEIDKAKVQAALQEAQVRATASLREAELNLARMRMEQELAVMKIAAEREMTMAEVRKEFGIKAMDIESKHQLASAEFAIKRDMGSGI